MWGENTRLSGKTLAKARGITEEINGAFSHQPIPGHDHIARPGTWFDEQGIIHMYENPEAISAGQFLAGKRWEDLVGIPLITWNEAYSSVIFVTNEASTYYLPAFMLTAIYHYHDAQTLVEGLLLHKLTHPFIRKELFQKAVAKLAEEIPEALQPHYRSAAQQEALEAHQVKDFEEFVTMLSLPNSEP